MQVYGTPDEDLPTAPAGVQKAPGVTVACCVDVGVGVGVELVSGEGVAGALGVGLGVGAGFLTTTPLFHTSFVPDLTQVNFLPAAVAVAPAFVHLAPALGVAA